MDTGNAEAEGRGDLGVGRSSGGLEQDMGTGHPTRRRFPFADYVMQVSLLLVGEVNPVFVHHEVSSC
jgi:hypothetical protein